MTTVGKGEAKDRKFRTLFTTAVLRVNPEPGADATSFGTGRHSRRDLEVGGFVPNACLVYAEDGEVFWLDLGDVGFVCDR